MWGRGLHGGRGWWYPPVSASKRYVYIGPCRCGTGPHGFYRDESGRIVHASQLYWGVPPAPEKEGLEAEIEALKEHKAELEKRIEEIEKQLKKKEE